MIVSNEQRSAVLCDQHLCLSSCPGSGKTRTIVAKLVRCLESLRNTTRRVCCITYTNAAVDEIEGRLRQVQASGDDLYYEVSTIHAFCLNHVLRPYHYRLPEFSNGFDVLAPDDPKWIELVQRLIDRHSLGKWTFDLFATIQREPGGPARPVSGISEVAALEFVTYLDAHAFVSFSDIIFHSARLVQCHPFIARSLGSRFAWWLIDEFQDTSESQVALFAAIAAYERSTFFLVGDPNQSIMSFAGGHPNLMRRFAQHIGARIDLSLTGNYRSSERIVIHANKLCACRPPMKAIGPYRDYAHEPSYVKAATIIDGLFDSFLPAIDALGIELGNSAVLAPWWVNLWGVSKELRKREVPVIGPGARPYKQSRDFAILAEHSCACVEGPDVSLLRSTHRALFITLLNINGHPPWNVFSYEGRKTLFRLLAVAKQSRRQHEGAADWLETTAHSFSEILVRDDLLPESKRMVLPKSAASMIADMKRNKVDVPNLPVSALGMYARPQHCLQLMTMHKAKGREFDAVALVDLHEGKLPHFSASTVDEIQEARRLLYVGVTRARKLLMYITDSSDTRNVPSRFLGGGGLDLDGIR